MEVFFAQIINGLSLGSLYVLLVTGFNLMLLVAKVIQFAYPQFVVLGMYMSWGVLRSTGSILLAILATLLFSILLNLLSEPIFRRINNVEEIDINISFVASLGISMVCVEIMSHSLNYGFPISFPFRWVGGSVINFGLINISRGDMFSILGGILVVVIFFYLLYRTTQGRLFRALAENRYVARMMGIPILKTSLYSYLAAGILGGIISVFFSMKLGAASAGLGEAVALKVLAVSIVAGLGNITGGLVVGSSLGIIESLAMGYIAGSWANVIAFVILLIVILTKPQGLFGSKL